MMKVKKARSLRNALMVAGVIIMPSAYLYEPLFFVALAVTFSALIPHFLYNKCPRCKKQLGRNEGDFCQFCGQKISD